MTPLDVARVALASGPASLSAGPLQGFWGELSRASSLRSPGSDPACLRLAQTWIDKGARLDQELGGATPLQLACLARAPGMIRALIALGADASKLNQSGVSALASAIDLGEAECAEALIAAGARLDLIRSPELAPLPLRAPEALELKGMSRLAKRAREALSSQQDRQAIERASAPASKASRAPSL